VRQPVEEVVFGDPLLPHVQRHGHRVLLDRLMPGYAPNSSSTVRNVWNSPSAAKNASGRATRRTTEHDTSPSFHWSPASSPTIDR
jgi:hypothetical protein